MTASGMTVTADGYVPRGGGTRAGGQRDRAERGSTSEGLGPVLVEVTLRLALFAGCVYTSVRFTQFLGKLKERESQVNHAAVVGVQTDQQTDALPSLYTATPRKWCFERRVT